MSYNNQTEGSKSKSYERWAKTLKIDELFRAGASRKEIAEKLGLKIGYVNNAITDNWIKDVPNGFKIENSLVNFAAGGVRGNFPTPRGG